MKEDPKRHTLKRDIALVGVAIAVTVGVPSAMLAVADRLIRPSVGITENIKSVPGSYSMIGHGIGEWSNLTRSIDEKAIQTRENIVSEQYKKNLMVEFNLSEEQYEDLKIKAEVKIDNELKILTANDRGVGGSEIDYKWRSLKAALSVDPKLPIPILVDSIGMPVISPETGKCILVNSPEAATYLKYLEQRYVDPSSYMIEHAQVLATGRRSDPSDAPKAEDILINPETGKPISAWFSFETVNALQVVLMEKTITGLAAQPPTA